MSIDSDVLVAVSNQGTELHDTFSSSLQKKLTINDKTIDEWWTYFYIDFTKFELVPQYCKVLDAQLARLYSEASYFLTVANITVNFMEKGAESLFQAKYAELINSWKQNQSSKLPAASTLETLAKLEQDELYSALAKARAAKEFWKSVLNYLDNCRKLIDNATFNSNIEARLTKNIESED